MTAFVRLAQIAADPAPAEVKPTLLAIARLEHKAREARRGRE